jgi:hypothetical protein
MLKKLLKINTDRVLSVTAMLIGVATFSIYLVQTRLIIDQQHANVWPCVLIAYSDTGIDDKFRSSFKVIANNKGIGPAIVKRVDIRYKNKKYDTFGDLFATVNPKKIGWNNSTLEGVTMSPSETITPIEIPLSDAGYRFRQLIYSGEVSVKIYYQSVYKKCYMSERFDAIELPDCSELEKKK